MRTRQTVPVAAACMALAVLLPACSAASPSNPAPSLPPVPTPTAKCSPTFVYDNVKDQGTALDVLDVETAYNGTANSAPFTLTSSHSHSVSIQASAQTITRFRAELDGGAVVVAPIPWDPVGYVAGQVIYNVLHQSNSSIQEQASVSAGSSITITIPPGAKGYGLYGIMMDVTQGDLSSEGCADLAQDIPETILAPTQYEWCVFTEGPDTFPEGGYGSSSCLVIGNQEGH